MQLLLCVQKFLTKQIRCDYKDGQGSVWGKTEHRGWEVNGVQEFVCCHPDHNCRGPTYDWDFIQFEEEGDRTLFPCRVLVGILEKEENCLDEVHLLVQSWLCTLHAEEGELANGHDNFSIKELQAASSHIFDTWVFDRTVHEAPLLAYSSPSC
jgi:hypothetical protein